MDNICISFVVRMWRIGLLILRFNKQMSGRTIVPLQWTSSIWKFYFNLYRKKIGTVHELRCFALYLDMDVLMTVWFNSKWAFFRRASVFPHSHSTRPHCPKQAFLICNLSFLRDLVRWLVLGCYEYFCSSVGFLCGNMSGCVFAVQSRSLRFTKFFKLALCDDGTWNLFFLYFHSTGCYRLVEISGIWVWQIRSRKFFFS